MNPRKEDKAVRLSVSLPASVAEALDRMVAERGFLSRSQAVAEMVHEHLARHAERLGDRVMAGTITLTYHRLAADCVATLASLQHQWLKECVASLHVQLENDRTLEVILVQGPADRLRQIADQMTAVKGVLSSSLNLTTSILPPLHAGV